MNMVEKLADWRESFRQEFERCGEPEPTEENALRQLVFTEMEEFLATMLDDQDFIDSYLAGKPTDGWVGKWVEGKITPAE